MKRATEVVDKGGTGDEEREVKRSIEVEESPKSEFNPFLVELILIKLLKLVDTVSQLKELRLLCQIWDEYSLEELEDRAFNGKLKAIDFIWPDDTKSEAEAHLVEFMEDTSAIPRLFSSFEFNFPESWIILCKHIGFFSIYPITFVHLGIPTYYLSEIKGLLIKFMESNLGSSLKEIALSKIYPDCDKNNSENAWEFGFPITSIFQPSFGHIERKLQKLDIKLNDLQFPRIFKSVFASGQYTNFTSFGFARFQPGDLDFPGLDLTKLTRLEIDQIGKGNHLALEFTSDLINLATNGMRLKNFGMNINLSLDLLGWTDLSEKLALICSNLTQFLTSQSSTLETLTFGFYCVLRDIDVEGADIWAKIHLPQFEVLHSLKLNINFKLIGAKSNPGESSNLFEMSYSPSAHFPKLVNLTLDGDCERSFIALILRVKSLVQADQIHLKRLEIIDHSRNWGPLAWSTSFAGVIGSVEELKCPAKLLYDPWKDVRLPWGESLRHLYINDINKEPRGMAFRLNHFEKLERIVARYDGINNDGWIRVERGSMKVEDFLSMFQEAAELPLNSITFVGPKMEEELKEEFINYFPFPVQFQITP